MKKIIVVSEEEMGYDDFKEPTGLYIINAMGDGIFFKTKNRAVAQGLCDEMYGEGFYTVRKLVKAVAR